MHRGHPARLDAACEAGGETVVIPVNHYHALKALTTLTFIEVQTGNPLVEEDIERSEWKWSE